MKGKIPALRDLLKKESIMVSNQNRSTILYLLWAVFLFFVVPAVGVGQTVPSKTDPPNIDVSIFRGINNAQSDFKTSVINVTDYSVLPIALALPIGFSGYGFIQNDDESFDTGVLLGSSEVLSYAVHYVLKVTVKRERPYQALSDVYIHHLDSADPYSFPSGHSTGAFAIATMLALRYPKPAVYIPAFAWAAIVGYGRIYFGLHYPSDVLAGALIGAGGSLLVNAYEDKILPPFRKLFGLKSSNTSALVLPTEQGGIVLVSVHF
ncbi:MAG: phosphatase PAP2 family protein [Bacteroidota bacterium]|nr:phosphatase PAP2 family protein [Bacteroidota bacterium]